MRNRSYSIGAGKKRGWLKLLAGWLAFCNLVIIVYFVGTSSAV
jgi:hypothetical protein